MTKKKSVETIDPSISKKRCRNKRKYYHDRIEKNQKSMSQHRKECCNKVEEMEAESSVVTKENYVTTKDEDERTEDCHDNIFYVATFQTYVAI